MRKITVNMRKLPLHTQARPYVTRGSDRHSQWWTWVLPAAILAVALAFVAGQIVGHP
jgi:uncharacterized membrane protein